MNFAHLRIAIPAAALLALTAVPALAQRPLSPEQRIMVLEQRLAASQASSVQLQQRLDALERQLQQLINQGETSGHRVSEVESDMASLRRDVEARLSAMESRPATVAADEPGADEAPDAEPAKTEPKRVASASKPDVRPTGPDDEAGAPSDPGEDAYSEGFHLWQDGRYDRAISALRAFTSAYPKHRRVSYANNLIGRALLDDGKPRAAAEALLDNYRSNPKGERAADSLYYLGQSLMKLNQPSQACKAYAELEDVYGSSVRAELKTLVQKGKAEAGCS
jgi:TolA-binding protein